MECKSAKIQISTSIMWIVLLPLYFSIISCDAESTSNRERNPDYVKPSINYKGQFRKGTEARYTDEVYTVKKVKGNAVTLDNDEVYKRSSLLIVPKTTVSDEQNVIVKVNKQNKINRNIDKEGLDVANIVLDKRKRNKLLNTLNNNVEEPKAVRRSSRIASVPRAVAPAQPAAHEAIDVDHLPGAVPGMRFDIYGRPLRQW